MTELKHKFTNDILFKLLFVKYPKLLKKLVAVLLKIPLDSIKNFEITNPEIPPEVLDGKFCRLDISMKVGGQLVDLEVQVEDEGDYPERSLYYWARKYSSALKKGMKYAELPRTIVISIVDFKMFDCPGFYSEFQILETTRHSPLSDRFSMPYFELPKLSDVVSANDHTELWLSLFRAKTEEELAKLEALEVPEMQEAIGAYRHVSVSEEFMELERMRSRSHHNEVSALGNAERRGREKGKAEERTAIAKSLLAFLPSDKIATATGLTFAEIETLRDAD